MTLLPRIADFKFQTSTLANGTMSNSPAAARNRQAFARHLGFPALAVCRQAHGVSVAVVDNRFSGEKRFDGCDALVTNRPGIGLMIRQADCQAVMLMDPERRVAANIHSGWRGSAADIIGRTIEVMRERFKVNPASLRAVISPSLGPCCAEFVNFRTELPPELHRFQVTENHFDFWAISRSQLTAKGVRENRIHAAGICTKCDHAYYSYRRDKTGGRFASVVGIVP